jgi:hypothetical protein
MLRLYWLVIIILLAGCSNDGPIKVKNEIKFGPYAISPPIGYWYFPRKFPVNIKSSEELFLLTFYKNKKATENRNPEHFGLFFNLGVTQNNYENIGDYYSEAKKSEVPYNDLPDEANDLLDFKEWSCKQYSISIGYGIECISLRKHLVTIAEIGEDKKIVIDNIPILKRMLRSFRN